MTHCPVYEWCPVVTHKTLIKLQSFTSKPVYALKSSRTLFYYIVHYLLFTYPMDTVGQQQHVILASFLTCSLHTNNLTFGEFQMEILY